MNNIYAPPKSNVEHEKPKSPRPKGVTTLAVVFVLLSAAITVLAYLDDHEGEWLIVFGCSVILIFLLRGVYFGRESDRKVGVFVGVLVAFMSAFELYEASEKYVEVQWVLNFAEGLFGLVASVYLMKLKGNPFFNE